MNDATLTPDLVNFVRLEKDRREIWESLLRYTRGIDRHDRDLTLAAYHPDAHDEHGIVQGVAADVVDWAIGWHGEFQTHHHHVITNHTVELDGDTAHGETYYMLLAENREGPPTLGFGRYIDRFERRDGHWAIAHRICINEFTGRFETAQLPLELAEKFFSTGPNRRDRGDLSYRRPL